MFLYGASGHAKVVIDILKKRNVSVCGFFDDNPEIKNKELKKEISLRNVDVFNNLFSVSLSYIVNRTLNIPE